MVCILCLGENSQSICEQLGGNVGGIDLLACPNSSALKGAIANAGKLQKVIINEKSIIGELPDSLKSGSFDVVFILKTPEILQKYAIEYYGYEHIQIVNKGNEVKFSHIELREYISATKIDDYKLYKEHIDNEPEEEQLFEESPIPEEPLTPFNNLQQESAPINIGQPTMEEPIIKLNPEAPSPVKESLYTEPTVKVAPVKGKKDVDDEIRHIISNYKDGNIIVMQGMPYSYCSTITWNLANYMSKLGKTVLLVDADSTFYPYGTLNKTLFDTSSCSTVNSIATAVKKPNWMQSAYLERTGLVVLSNNIVEDGFDYALNKDLFIDFIKKQRKVFDVVLIDLPYHERFNLQELIKDANQVVYTVRHTNKDYLKLMRTIQTLDPEVQAELSEKSCYIEIDPDNKKLLNTKSKDVNAIDIFLEDIFGIGNEHKYENIQKVGEIFTDRKHKYDYIDAPYIMNDKEIQSLWINILNVNY